MLSCLKHTLLHHPKHNYIIVIYLLVAGADPGGGGDWVSSHPPVSLKCR